MYYNFDTSKLARWLLPPILRRKGLLALIDALAMPLSSLSDRMSSYADGTLRKLSYNAFTNYLERFLNELFGGGIYITDYADEDFFYMSYKDETLDTVYVGISGEEGYDPPVYLSSEQPDRISGGFIVNIPESLSEKTGDIGKWVDYYKFAGVKYIIKTY